MKDLIVTEDQLVNIKSNAWIEFACDDFDILFNNITQAKVYTAILSKVKVNSNVSVITIKEIQDKSKLCLSSIYRAIRSLKDLGFIEVIAKNTYKTRNKRVKL